MPATKKTPQRVRASADATKKRAEAALKRAGGSLDQVQKALAELQKDLGRGRRNMVRNVQQLLKDQRRDLGKLSRTLSADMRGLQKALTEEPASSRAKGARTGAKGAKTRAKGAKTRAKGAKTRRGEGRKDPLEGRNRTGLVGRDAPGPFPPMPSAEAAQRVATAECQAERLSMRRPEARRVIRRHTGDAEIGDPREQRRLVDSPGEQPATESPDGIRDLSFHELVVQHHIAEAAGGEVMQQPFTPGARVPAVGAARDISAD